jgi:hypothetical protein
MPNLIEHDTSARYGDVYLPPVDLDRTRINWAAVSLVVFAVLIDAAVVGGLFALAYGIRALVERLS